MLEIVHQLGHPGEEQYTDYKAKVFESLCSVCTLGLGPWL